MVMRYLAKVDTVGSSPIIRSISKGDVAESGLWRSLGKRVGPQKPRRFKSCRLRHFQQRVFCLASSPYSSSLAEHLVDNREVTGSSPVRATNFVEHGQWDIGIALPVATGRP